MSGSVGVLAGRVRTVVALVLGRAAEVGAAFGYELVMLITLAVIYPVTVRALGPEQYGEYTTLYVITGLAVAWVHSGCSAAMVQLIVQRERRADLVLARARRQVVFVALPLGVLGVAATIALLGSHLWIAAAMVLAVDLIVGGIASIHIAVVFARLGAGPSSVVRAVNPIARLLGVGGLALAGQVTLVNLVLVNGAATVVMLVAARTWSRSTLRSSPADGTEPHRRELGSLTAMYAASMSTNAAQGEGDKIALAHFRPIIEVGEYQAAYRIASIGSLPLQALSNAAVRWFLPSDARPRAQVRKAMLLSIPIVGYGLVVIVGVIVAQPLIRWVIGDEFETAATITLWLAGLPLFYGLAEVPMMGLLGLGENRTRMFVGFGTAAVALGLFIVLTPAYGWQGTVAAIYASEVVSVLVAWLVLFRCQVQYDARRVSSVEP